MVTLTMDSGTVLPTKWYSNSKKLGHPIFTSTSALRRGILKQRRGRNATHFNGDSCEHGTLFFKQFIP